MIHTTSVINGYGASLGFWLLSLGFFIGSWFVEIPSEE